MLTLPLPCKLELLADSQIHDTFPVSRLKRASAAEFSNMDETAPLVLEDEDSAYDVASILDHDDRQDGRYYLIQWKGVQPLHHYRATWEPRSLAVTYACGSCGSFVCVLLQPRPRV